MNIRTTVLFAVALQVVACSSPTSSTNQSAPATSAAVSVIVLDSLGGTPVAGIPVTVTDQTNPASATDYSGKSGTNGYPAGSPLTLTLGDLYTVSALPSVSAGRAASELISYAPNSGDNLGLYCPLLGISGVPATAPTVVSVQDSTDGTTWTTFTPGAALRGSFQIRVSVKGTVAVLATSLSGFGIGIGIDQIPTSWNGYNTAATPKRVTTSASAVIQGDGTFLTTDTFNFTGLTFLPGSHTLYLVAYDVANNRVEERIPFTQS